MATKENQKVLPRYNRSAPRPGISRGTSGKAALTRFGTKLFPFPVNLGPTRTYDSAMGGNASTGLGSADHHSYGRPPASWPTAIICCCWCFYHLTYFIFLFAI